MYFEYLQPDYDVTEAADGLDALEALRRQLPDVIVTDLALPRMDGFALLERLRADERTTGIPVIALSGYSGREHEDRAREAGSAIVLQKPCLPDTLVDALSEVLARRGTDGGV
jgi:CheY-like chemotaxis protein